MHGRNERQLNENRDYQRERDRQDQQSERRDRQDFSDDRSQWNRDFNSSRGDYEPTGSFEGGGRQFQRGYGDEPYQSGGRSNEQWQSNRNWDQPNQWRSDQNYDQNYEQGWQSSRNPREFGLQGSYRNAQDQWSYSPSQNYGQQNFRQNLRQGQGQGQSQGMGQQGWGQQGWGQQGFDYGRGRQDQSMYDSRSDRSHWSSDRGIASSGSYAEEGWGGYRQQQGSGMGWEQPLGQRQEQRSGKGPRGYKRSDERIREDICDRLCQGSIDASEVDVTVSNGEVTLKGSVCDRREKHSIEDLVESISGVNDVKNEIRVVRSKESEDSETSHSRRQQGQSQQHTSTKKGSPS